MKKKKRWPMVLLVVVIILTVAAGILWHMFSPMLGYGSLSDTVTSSMLRRARKKFTVEEYKDEHLASFRFGYKIDAVRDWIYAQVK